MAHLAHKVIAQTRVLAIISQYMGIWSVIVMPPLHVSVDPVSNIFNVKTLTITIL